MYSMSGLGIEYMLIKSKILHVQTCTYMIVHYNSSNAIKIIIEMWVYNARVQLPILCRPGISWTMLYIVIKTVIYA